MKRILVALVATIAIAGGAPAAAQASYTSENQCTSPLINNGSSGTAAYYNNARYGGGQWQWNGNRGWPNVSVAINWTYRESDSAVQCRISWYGIPFYSGYGVGNRCQFYGRAVNGALSYSKFEQCYGFDVWY